MTERKYFCIFTSKSHNFSSFLCLIFFSLNFVIQNIMALRAHNRVNSHINKKLSRSQSLNAQIKRYPALDRKLDSV